MTSAAADAVTSAADAPAGSPSASSAPPRRPPGLVVVATLVDKIPNLAGLARTCEAGGCHTTLLLFHLNAIELRAIASLHRAYK